MEFVYNDDVIIIKKETANSEILPSNRFKEVEMSDRVTSTIYLGSTPEIVSLLNEYIKENGGDHPDQDFYFVIKLSRKSLEVYEEYLNKLNEGKKIPDNVMNNLNDFKNDPNQTDPDDYIVEAILVTRDNSRKEVKIMNQPFKNMLVISKLSFIFFRKNKHSVRLLLQDLKHE